MQPSFKIKLYKLTIRLLNTKAVSIPNSSLLRYPSTAATSAQLAFYYDGVSCLHCLQWRGLGGLNSAIMGTFTSLNWQMWQIRASLPLYHHHCIRTGQQTVGFAMAGPISRGPRFWGIKLRACCWTEEQTPGRYRAAQVTEPATGLLTDAQCCHHLKSVCFLTLRLGL